MRVIAGSAKGKRLTHVPKGVRPVSDRAREGLFSSLAIEVPGAVVLDLFAGTGALGIEALSRGAERAVFVDRDRASIEAVRENLARTGLADRASIVASEVNAFLGTRGSQSGSFDLILMDPPYGWGPPDLDTSLRSLEGWLSSDAWTVVLTRGTRSSTPVVPVNWQIARRLVYGDSLVICYRPRSHPKEPGSSMGLTALCPGTFDPVTNGHLDIIGRSTQMFDAVVVGVLENPSKQPLFDAGERLEMLEAACVDLRNVRVAAFSGLLVEFARREAVHVMVKGLRAVSDYEYEIQMAQMNHRLAGIETLFMSTSPKWSFLSSSLVKEVARFGGSVEGLVPDVVNERLLQRLGVRA